jgi:hypothetical protein
MVGERRSAVGGGWLIYAVGPGTEAMESVVDDGVHLGVGKYVRVAAFDAVED